MPAKVIDLCSDDEDVPQPFIKSPVGVVSSSINSSNAQDFDSDYEGNSDNKRYVIDIIDGIEIYQFASEVDMEFHANHEALPRRDELFRGFDIKNQPSTVLMDFFNKSRMREPWLASHCIPSDANIVHATTAPPPSPSTESSATKNTSVEENFYEAVVPMPIQESVCQRCGVYRKVKRSAPLPSITGVISLDSDDEEDNNYKKLEEANETPPTSSGTSSERSFLVISGSCSLSSENNVPKFTRALENDVNTISTSITSSVGDEIICLDSDDDTATTSHISPVKVANTNKRRYSSMQNRCHKKHINSHTTESTTTPILIAPTSLKTVNHMEKEGTVERVGNDNILPNISVHSRRSSETQTDLSSAFYSCTLFVQNEQIICLDDNSDSSDPVQMKNIKASSNSTLNLGYKKRIAHLPQTVCKSKATLFPAHNAPMLQKAVSKLPHKEFNSCAVSQKKRNMQSDATTYSKFSDEFLSTTSLRRAGCLKVINTKTVSDFILGQDFHKNIDLKSEVMGNFLAISSGILNDPLSQALDRSEFEDIVELLQDAVSFVCRQEEIANIPVLLEPYDENYSTNSSPNGQNVPPCSKEYCRMGCVCSCIRKKFKRKRCDNLKCTFGCICYSSLKPRRSESQRFPAKYEDTFSASSEQIPLKHRNDSFKPNNNDNKSDGVNASLRQENNYTIASKCSHRKKTLTHKEISSQDYIILKPKLTKYDVAVQPIKTSRQMVQQSLWKSNSHFMKKKFRGEPSIFQMTLKNNGMFLKHPFPTNQDLKKSVRPHQDFEKSPVQTNQGFKKSPVQTHQDFKKFPVPTHQDFKKSPIPTHQDFKNSPVQTHQPDHDLASTDDPPPAFALTCLTPGIGYIALEEFGPSILRVCDPFDPSCSRHFTSVSLATGWLNGRLRENLEFDDGVELKWLMANSIMLQRKKIKRFDRNVLLDPRCRITKNGVLFV